jgi:hypothetical protein
LFSLHPWFFSSSPFGGFLVVRAAAATAQERLFGAQALRGGRKWEAAQWTMNKGSRVRTMSVSTLMPEHGRLVATQAQAGRAIVVQRSLEDVFFFFFSLCAT